MSGILDDRKAQSNGSNGHALKGTAPTLAELQSMFQLAVTTTDQSILELVCDSDKTNRETLFGVYRNAYVRRLIEIIRNDHPLLAIYLGDGMFEDMAKLYIARHPSRAANARWVASKLPDFLGSRPPFCENNELHELAAIERALNTAFDSSDGQVIGLAALTGFVPEDWGALAFAPHPSAQRLDNLTNAAEIWLALQSESLPPKAKKHDEIDRLIVWRDGVIPKLRRLSTEEAMMWDEAARGVSFAELCELCTFYDDPNSAPHRAASYLNTWLSTGLLSKATLCESV